MSQWLFDTLLMTSALMVFVLIVREPVRARFGASAAYALWLIPAARMAMPTLTTTVEREVPIVESTPLPAVTDVPMSFASVSSAPTEVSLIEALGGLATIAIYVWIAGAALMMVRGFAQYHRQREGVLGSAQQLAKLDNIRIVRSDAITGPLAFGFIDRIIALPTDFDIRFDASQRRLALDHELAHHRSGDLYINLFAYVLLCLQWFNPLAWMSHAAFRFDQEAACDARVLDKAKADDRAAYGHAIAKAASGRALLFAGALDRPSTLQRRLKSMLNDPTRSKRNAGKLLAIGTMLVALPLTATKAIDYVDVPVAPKAPAAPEAPPAPKAPAAGLERLANLASAPFAPAPPIAPIPPKAPAVAVAPLAPIAIQSSGTRTFHMNGVEKRWEDLTEEEKAEVRQSLRDAREELRKAKRDQGKAMAEARREIRETKIDREKIRREMAEGRAEIERALQEVERDAAKLRAEGKNPETVRMALRTAQASLAAIDVDKIVTDAVNSVDMEAIERSVEQSLEAAEREIERVEREIEREEKRN